MDSSQAVILNACHTQSASFFRPSLAMSIYKTGVPLVLANQTSVRDEEAIQTAKGLYEHLFQEGHFSGLLNTARIRVKEWWKPVLFTSPDLKGDERFLPPSIIPEGLEAERVFRDLGTWGTTKVYVYRYRPLREITEYLNGDYKSITLQPFGN